MLEVRVPGFGFRVSDEGSRFGVWVSSSGSRSGVVCLGSRFPVWDLGHYRVALGVGREVFDFILVMPSCLLWCLGFRVYGVGGED